MMSLTDLWLPILLSAVFVFIASSILHMVIPIHKSDFKKMPGEEKVLAEMRSQSVQPGSYTFPCAGTMKNMGSPEMVEKFKLGPVGFVTVVPNGPPAIGKSLAQVVHVFDFDWRDGRLRGHARVGTRSGVHVGLSADRNGRHPRLRNRGSARLHLEGAGLGCHAEVRL